MLKTLDWLPEIRFECKILLEMANTAPSIDEVDVDEKEHCQDGLEQEETLQQPPQLLWHCSRVGKREP